MPTTTSRPQGPPAATRPVSRGRGRLVTGLLVLAVAAGGAYVWSTGHFADVVVNERCTATARGMTTTLTP